MLPMGAEGDWHLVAGSVEVVKYDKTSGAAGMSGDTVACNLVAGSVGVAKYDDTSGAAGMSGDTVACNLVVGSEMCIRDSFPIPIEISTTTTACV